MNILTKTDLAKFEGTKQPEVETSNFRLSFILLPKTEKNAICSIYNFCSYIDDIVDTPESSDNTREIKHQRLDFWEQVIDDIYTNNVLSPYIKSLVQIINRYNLPKQYFLTLIDGCRRDLNQNRYKTWNELKDYCYSVASVVGLMSIEIFGYKYEETKNYAINLGYALQLTNILRDIKEDKDRGYIYLPLEDMEHFGYSEEDLINEVYNEEFLELMRFEVVRAREYYHKARQLLHPDEYLTTFSAGIMDEIYFRILEKIELREYNVFKKKVSVSGIHKFMIMLKHWLHLLLFIRPRHRK